MQFDEIKEKVKKLKQTIDQYNRCEDFFKHHVLPMVCVQQNGIVIDCNDSFCILLNRQKKDIVGSHASSYYSNPAELKSLIEIINQNGSIEGMQISLKDSSENPIPVQIFSNIRSNNGTWINSRCLFVPIR